MVCQTHQRLRSPLLQTLQQPPKRATLERSLPEAPGRQGPQEALRLPARRLLLPQRWPWSNSAVLRSVAMPAVQGEREADGPALWAARHRQPSPPPDPRQRVSHAIQQPWRRK